MERGLVTRTGAIGALGILLIGSLTGLNPATSASWFVVVVVVWVSIIGYTTGRGHLLPHAPIGLANAITLVRGFLVSLLAGFVVLTPSTSVLPAALYLAAIVLDAVDGAVARRTLVTSLGRFLDRYVDAHTILVGAGVGVALGTLPWWYLLAGLVWYLFAGSLWIRERLGGAVFALPPSRIRRPVGIMQLVLIGAGLLPDVIPVPLAPLAAIALACLLLSFLRDWLWASGRAWVVPGPAPAER